MKMSLIVAPALVGAPGGRRHDARSCRLERGAPSASSLQTSVEAALERGDLSTAVRMTEAAHRRAISDRRWESLIEVGDLVLPHREPDGRTRRGEPEGA